MSHPKHDQEPWYGEQQPYDPYGGPLQSSPGPYPPQQEGYPPQQERYPRQQEGYPQQGYPPDPGYPPQPGYPSPPQQQNPYAPQRRAPEPDYYPPQPGYPDDRGYPDQRGYQPPAYPQQGYPQPTYPPESYPPDPYASEPYPPESYAPTTYSPESYPAATYPAATYPPESYPPATYPPATYSPTTYPPPGTYPPATYPASGYPDAGQAGSGRPAQPYRDPYGAPSEPYGSGPGQDQSHAPAGKNGFATAGLILGILPTVVLGLVFGVLGVLRSSKVGRGKVRAWFAIGLSLLWIWPFAYFGTHIAKASDPGCIAVKALMFDSPLGKQWGNEKDLKTYEADTQSLVTQLNAAAATSNSDAARGAITTAAGDLQQLLTGLKKGNVPTDAQTTKADADFDAVDKACGTLGA